MKKIFIIMFSMLSVLGYSQQTYKTNVRILKTNPSLLFSGTGGVINFNDLMTLTHGTGVLTLAGGNFALGTGSLTLTGSIASTGSRATKGWFTNLEITNYPTVNGLPFFQSPTFTGTVTIPSPFTLGSTSVLSSGTELNILDGALVNKDELNKLVGLSHADSIIATRQYVSDRLDAKLSPSDTTNIDWRLDSLAANINTIDTSYVSKEDTVVNGGYMPLYSGNLADDYATGLISDQQVLIDSLFALIYDLQNQTVDLDDYAVMLTDTINHYTFGLGSAILKDTAAFVNGAKAGGFYHYNDSLKIAFIESYLDPGSGTETIDFQVYYGTNNGTAIDSLFSPAITITSLTGQTNIPDEATIIPPKMKVWSKVSGASEGNKPSGFIANLMVYKLRTEE